MSRYSYISDLKAAGQKGYMPYVMLGYPTKEACLAACKTLLENGAHGLELGLPFSDPVADGPVIEAAGQATLAQGFHVADAVDLVREIRTLAEGKPLTLMAYANMVQVHGVTAFVQKFADADVDGLLVPDISLEAATEFAPVCKAHGVANIMLASPLTDEARLEKIAPLAEGFLYVVTRLGITGTHENYSAGLEDLFKKIKSHIALPAYAGFGISTSEQAQKMLAAGADGVITGSQIVKLLNEDAINFLPLTTHTKNMVEALV